MIFGHFILFGLKNGTEAIFVGWFVRCEPVSLSDIEPIAKLTL